MANIWTPRRPEMSEALIRVASPVSHLTWQGGAYLANYLRGKGSMLVPWSFASRTISASATETFRFRVRPRSSAVQRIWMLQLRTTASAGVTAEVASPSGGTAATYAVASSLDARVPVVYTENLASKSSVEAQIEVTIKASGGAVIVEGIACYEQDRPLLNSDSTDYGTDVVTLATGQPIFDGSNVSFGGVMDALANADARRVGIFHWTLGDGVATQTAATYIPLMDLAVPVLAQKAARAATTAIIKWSAYARMAAGTGNIRVTTTASGVSDVASITGASFAWTTARSITIGCDDMASSDGRQSSTWDDLQIEIQGNGVNALSVCSVSFWVDDFS